MIVIFDGRKINITIVRKYILFADLGGRTLARYET